MHLCGVALQTLSLDVFLVYASLLKFLRALHLSIFEQPPHPSVFQHPAGRNSRAIPAFRAASSFPLKTPARAASIQATAGIGRQPVIIPLRLRTAVVTIPIRIRTVATINARLRGCVTKTEGSPCETCSALRRFSSIIGPRTKPTRLRSRQFHRRRPIRPS